MRQQFMAIWFPVVLVMMGGSAASAATLKGTVAHKKGKLNLVVYVAKAGGKFSPPSKAAVLGQKNRKFTPHVLPILVGTSVKFVNDDGVEHNVFSPDPPEYDLGTWPPGEQRTQVFAKEGVFAQLCKIHPEMEGYIVVLANPYFAKTKKDGSFVIKKIPDGKYEMKVWGKRLSAKEKERTFTVEVAQGKEPVTLDFTQEE